MIIKYKQYIFISAAVFCAGIFFLAYNQGWILLKFPSYKREAQQTAAALRAQKKSVTLFFWHNKRWNKEAVEILHTHDAAQTAQHLLNSWLTLLDEEQVMVKKVMLQSALLSDNKQLYLSFDRNPFNEHDATYDKLLWVEGLLRTIRENDIPVQAVRFLVHHQPMQDYHLDFSNSWPLAGFLACPS